MKVRKTLEKDQSIADPYEAYRNGSIIECPWPNDVIVSETGPAVFCSLKLCCHSRLFFFFVVVHFKFRSGNKVFLFHPGNLLFRNLVESKYEEHEYAQTQSAKVDITRAVIAEILVERGGRFVVWDKDLGWYVQLTNESQIREKVAVYMREFKKRVRAMGNHQVNESSTEKFQQQNGGKRRRFNKDCDVSCM